MSRIAILLVLGAAGLAAATDATKASSEDSTKSSADSQSSVPDYKQYEPDYSKFIPMNMSKMTDYGQYIPKLEQYQDVDKYIKFAKYMGSAHNDAPSSAEKCNTTAQLDAWRKMMEAPMNAFIPKEFRSLSTSHFEEEYAKNLKRIEDAKKEKQGDTAASVSLAASLGDYDTNKGAAPSKSAADSKAPSIDWAHLVPDFKQNVPDWKDYVPANTTSFDFDKFVPDFEKYMDVKKYQDFADASAKGSDAPSKASECTTMKELDAWRKVVSAPVDAYIPKAWRSSTTDSINEEYEKNKKRIEAAEDAKKGQDDVATADAAAAGTNSRRLAASPSKSSAQSAASDNDKFVPNYAKYQDVQKFMKFSKLMQDTKAPASAADCKTKKELDAWRSVTEAPIKAFVPKKWQHFQSIQQKYNDNLKRIENNQAQAGQKETAAIAVPTELQVEDGFARGAQQFTPMRIETPEVQDLVPSYAKYYDVQLFLSFATFVKGIGAPEKAQDCKTMNQLNAWHKKQNAIMKEFVPQAYQSFPAHALEKKYAESKKRIEATEKTTESKQASAQLASVANNAGTPLIALAAVMFSAALVASISWRLRRESTLEERLLDPEAPLAA